MMEAGGVGRRRRRLMWLGVRLFGWTAWLGHTQESVAGARRYISLSFAGDGGRRRHNNTQKGTGK